MVAKSPLDAHALIVQITGYPAMPLPQVQDADDLAATLRDPSLCGYDEDQVRVLKDGEASRASLIAAIESLVAAANTASTVLFYFSGHGGQVKGQTYVVPYDASASDLAGTSISAEELRRLFGRCRARRVLLVFDCCYADGLDAKDVLPLEPGLSARAHEILGEWVIFAASRAGERSYVLRGQRNGLFTSHFLGGLREGALDGDDFVGPMGLFRYLAPRVTQAEPRQHPVFNCKLEKDFPIARYQGGRKAIVPKADHEFEYHALLSFAEADAELVAQTLLPRLVTSGLKIATASEDLVAPGMDRVLGLERGLELARRTIVVLSRAFLQQDAATDKYTDFALLQRKHRDIERGRYTVLPVYIEPVEGLTPLWLRSLVGLRLGAALRPMDSADRQLDKLIEAVQKPVPRRNPG